MRAGKDAKRPIVVAAIVKVESDGEHALEDIDRRLDMDNAGLHRPGAEPRHIDAIAHGDGAILVPCEEASIHEGLRFQERVVL